MPGGSNAKISGLPFGTFGFGGIFAAFLAVRILLGLECLRTADLATNPKGIEPSSPGLRAASNPGSGEGGDTTPTGLRHSGFDGREGGRNAVGVEGNCSAVFPG